MHSPQNTHSESVSGLSPPASIFVGFVILVDFFLVALIINKSMDMFASFIGTWLPFMLIFTATYLTGIYVSRQAVAASA